MPETLLQLQESGETFYGFFEGQMLCGAISFKLEHQTLDIHRLIVHPNHSRKGIAKSILEFVLKLEPEARRCIVQTGVSNLPAKTLYQRMGFIELEQHEVEPKLWIYVLEKTV